MRIRPPATDACDPEESAPGNPNAHFSRRFGTSSAVIPAASALWKRAFELPLPQPFQAGPASGSPGAAPGSVAQ